MRPMVGLACAVAVLFCALALTTPWQVLELKGFDALTRATAPHASQFPITIVAIDEASFAHVGKQWPWPREVYARAVDHVRKAGALVIALDVVLDTHSNAGAGDDHRLVEALRSAGNVVLASSRVYEETSVSRQWLRVDPQPMFLEGTGAVNGYVNFELDSDLVARRMPFAADAFWKRIVERLSATQPELVRVEPPARGAMMRYVGGDHTFPYISFYQVLDGDESLPADAFRDQIVLIGRDIKANVDVHAAQADLFASPFTASSDGLMPGVELHANALETAFRGAAIRPVEPAWVAGLVTLVVAFCAATMRHWRPLMSGAVLIATVAALAGADWVLFQRMNLWLPVFGAMVSAIAMYIAYGGVAFVVERQRRGEIRRAFSLYVSDEVVDHVMAHPERLHLGGERREVTMMFTDLEGFTTLTERLGAEQVAQVLNLHFTRATAIVKRHGGTVNRFIGDAIMAMWGAPVEDPEQAAHACLAACEMQRDVEALNGDLTARGLPPIRMRIGLHSCVAVVGNLGSADRFDYTAIGDGVNLAARLEGVNKLYGTTTLLTGQTASKAGAAIAVRPVDRVIVKGKTEPVEIFTPCDDAAVLEATRRAVEAYRDRKLEQSEQFWRQVVAITPDDGVARVYLARLRIVATMPDTAWKDAVELEKL